MAKEAYSYLSLDPWAIREVGFHKDRNKVSESLFCIANEYMGIRGVFEEGTSLPTLRGSYFNGVYEYARDITPHAYKGIVERTHFMINSVDWIKTHIIIDGKALDLAASNISEFVRELSFKNGLLTRSFVWHLNGEKCVKIIFERFVSMVDVHRGFQRITLIPNFEGEAIIYLSLDSNVVHWGRDCYWNPVFSKEDCLLVKTPTTHQKLCSAMKVISEGETTSFQDELITGRKIKLKLRANHSERITRLVTNVVDKNNQHTVDELEKITLEELSKQVAEGYDFALAKTSAYWHEVYLNADIEIDGDKENQQGIRFCIFQLQQTYHGVSPMNNIGAKGLTGEAYSGHAFWDTETYCLPYFLFHDIESAKHLLMYRYHTLPEARVRAKQLDCEGACYPIATLNGQEACNLWQHASLQFQPSTAVAYGIWHYIHLTDDREFLKQYGLEMLIDISRFLLSRGDWDASHNYFGFYGVMGPDEFQMMVNHNTYTNYMAKRTFEYLLESIDLFKGDEFVVSLLKRMNVDQEFLDNLKIACERMKILYDTETKCFEQHEGFFSLPHVDIDKIPVTDFPLYSHWSYDRIYRNDMIKQPDVLMFMFLYNQSFSYEEKKANYEYYEPRCIHESSLSPSIHSIFASELGKEEEALDFFGFATRMDLDDYNRNTHEGLHMTSIAAAWMNIVYGFGGLRSDGELLKLAPSLPKSWKRYKFRIIYKGALLTCEVSKNKVVITSNKEVTIRVYDEVCKIDKEYIVKRG